jgi:hypothetical protein
VSTPLRQNRAVLSRRTREQLGALQATVQDLGTQRSYALRVLQASRHAATRMAQQEFWLEFALADQEYRVAVRRLAMFCSEHGHLAPRVPSQSPPLPAQTP